MGLKFSVITSVYKNDKPEFIRQAFDSITIGQTLCPDEVVVVIDGPVSQEISVVIDEYAQLHSQLFNIIRLPENKGLGNALKVGLEASKYDIVARMDSDDYSISERFAKQVAYLESHTEVDIVGGNMGEFIGAVDNIVGVRNVPEQNVDINNYIKARCPFNHITVMFRKQAVMNAGGYLDWHYNEDYYLWIRMALNNCTFANLPDILCYARVGKDMYARRGGWKYFKSEAKLQKYMFDKGLISFFRMGYNVLLRFVLQVCMPNKLRGFVFRKFARK
ncbi:MAG: glycosyltransferase [Rikenellaceae bacterium]|nr:glycosyltransferase [Rikenellaceae bacterium]